MLQRTTPKVLRRQEGQRDSILTDLVAAWRLGPMWRAFAWDEIQNRYRRSRLGLAWIAISYLAFVLGIGVFFGGFSAMGTDGFFAHVALGYAVFLFVTANLTDGCQVFRQARSWIRSTDLPYGTYVFKSVARGLFVFAVSSVCALVVSFLCGWRPTAYALLALPGLAALLVTAVWTQYLLGLVAARFRDVDHLVGTITRLLFFTTPILWVLEEREGAVRTLAAMNPVTHFVEAVRAPLLGSSPGAVTWAVILAVNAVGVTLTLTWGARQKRHLPFYL